jgi:hypothetical protein
MPASKEVPAKSLVPRRDGTGPSNGIHGLHPVNLGIAPAVDGFSPVCPPVSAPWLSRRVVRWEIRGRWNRHVVGGWDVRGRLSDLLVERDCCEFQMCGPGRGPRHHAKLLVPPFLFYFQQPHLHVSAIISLFCLRVSRVFRRCPLVAEATNEKPVPRSNRSTAAKTMLRSRFGARIMAFETSSCPTAQVLPQHTLRGTPSKKLVRSPEHLSTRAETCRAGRTLLTGVPQRIGLGSLVK